MQNSSPLVSVVIPMYNSEKTIENTLRSVSTQTYTHIEVIVIDDGSTDSSASLVEQFAVQNPQMDIQLIRKANGGVSTARNAGMKQSKGDFIALLDSDDEWLPKKLEIQIEIFHNNPGIDFLGSTRNGEYFSRFFFKKFFYLTHISSRLLLYKTFLTTPTTLFKRTILDTVGYFDETQKYAEEGNYWIRVCKDNHCVLQNESLVITGGGKPDFGFSGLSSNLKQMELGELKNIRDGLNLKIIGRIEYVFLVLYSLIKYVRRILIVKLRK
jgi:glycosyltransferase involved in cell wall biosynthesis